VPAEVECVHRETCIAKLSSERFVPGAMVLEPVYQDQCGPGWVGRQPRLLEELQAAQALERGFGVIDRHERTAYWLPGIASRK